MKFIGVIALISLLHCHTAFAETIDTGSFKITIPDTMRVSWNKKDTILAVNPVSTYSPPFLQIGYASLKGNYKLYFQKMKHLFENYPIESLNMAEYPKNEVLSGYKKETIGKSAGYDSYAIIKRPDMFLVVRYLCDKSEIDTKQFFNDIIN